MKVLFFLPGVTPWWFDEIIAPMLRALLAGPQRVEAHVVTAKLWRNTGITPENYLGVADLPGVQWHIVDAADPAAFRFAAAKVEGLRELAAGIDPDLVLARSPDLALAELFPGTVRWLMEAAAPPFATDVHWIVLDEQPFHHGFLPAGVDAFADDCAARLAPPADAARARLAGDHRAALGLPADRPVLAVPLHYEHPENLVLVHAAHRDGTGLLAALLDTLDPAILLAVSDHPLNRLHVDRAPLDVLAARHPDRIALFTGAGQTDRLAACADAMTSDLSKTWTLGAFLGTPLLNLGRPMADWLGALPGLTALPARFSRDSLPAADPVAARRWFGWHIGGRLVDPARLDVPQLLRRVAGQPDAADAAQACRLVLDRQEIPA
ncbi:MAG: hypothetical protein KGM17_08620 [Sphingomonadales bacterium]|nr:hypothetical protein [Sphingomonadales bacterium]